MEKPLVSIHLIVKDGEKYIRGCLSHVKKQTYPNIEFRVFDNASSDQTVEIVKEMMPEAEIVQYPKNYVVGGGFNRSLPYSKTPYVVMLCVDVIMNPTFIERAVEVAEKDARIGVVQAKIMRYDYEGKKITNKIDTVGLQIFRSRRVVNRGHGEEDVGQYERAEDIFCYEGAVPFFRREALEDTKEENQYLDEDFVWYADELDLGWRMRHRGWKSWYDPQVLAAHDRQTTTQVSKGYLGFIRMRRTIPSFKRSLDYSNQRLSFIKNERISVLLRHFPYWATREMLLFFYFIAFEQTTLPAYWRIIKMTPLMLKKRKIIIRRSVMDAQKTKKWFL